MMQTDLHRNGSDNPSQFLICTILIHTSRTLIRLTLFLSSLTRKDTDTNTDTLSTSVIDTDKRKQHDQLGYWIIRPVFVASSLPILRLPDWSGTHNGSYTDQVCTGFANPL